MGRNYVSNNFGRPIKLLDSLPPQSPKLQKTNAKKANTAKNKINVNAWQLNYINEYSKLFEEKEQLKMELTEKQLMLKKVSLRPETAEKSTQTDPPLISDQPQQLIPLQEQTQVVLATSPANIMPSLPPLPLPKTQPKGTTKPKKQPKTYVCECGYDAGNRKNRLTNHQKQFCKLLPRTVKLDFSCPICGIPKTYDGMKSHLLQFANPKRKNQTREGSAHAGKDAAYHSQELEKFKAKYGPKKHQH